MQGDKLVVKLLKAMDDPAAATLFTLMEAMETYCAPKHDASLRQHETKGWRISLRLCDQIGKPMAKLVGGIETVNSQ